MRDCSALRSLASIAESGWDLLHPKAKRHVLLDRHVGEEAVLLEDHADVALAGRDVRDVAPVEDDPALGDALQAGEAAQQRGLAAARGAEQRDEVALIDAKVDVVQDRVVAKALDHALEFNVGHLGYSLPVL